MCVFFGVFSESNGGRAFRLPPPRGRLRRRAIAQGREGAMATSRREMLRMMEASGCDDDDDDDDDDGNGVMNWEEERRRR